MECGEGSTGPSSGVSMGPLLGLSGKTTHPSTSLLLMSPLLSSPPLSMLSPHPPHLTQNTCRQHTQHMTPTYTHTKPTHTSGSLQTSCRHFQRMLGGMPAVLEREVNTVNLGRSDCPALSLSLLLPPHTDSLPHSPPQRATVVPQLSFHNYTWLVEQGCVM